MKGIDRVRVGGVNGVECGRLRGEVGSRAQGGAGRGPEENCVERRGALDPWRRGSRGEEHSLGRDT